MDFGLRIYYRALDNIDYNSADFRYISTDGKRDKVSISCKISSLKDLACSTVCHQNAAYIESAVKSLPSLLLGPLLNEAICCGDQDAITAIIKNWPFKSLVFKDILYPSIWDIFEKRDISHALSAVPPKQDLMIYNAICSYGSNCKVECFDFRGLRLNDFFTRRLVQRLQIHAMKVGERDIRKLLEVILKNADLQDDSRIRVLLSRVLSNMIHCNQRNVQSLPTMNIPKGKKVDVLMDEFILNGETYGDFEYFIGQALRPKAPLTVTACNIIICSPFMISEPTLLTTLPFIVFKSQDKKLLSGLAISDVQEGVILNQCPKLQTFTHLTGLALSNCCLHMRHGTTRGRIQTREPLLQLLATLPLLNRLDLSCNHIAGCLGEVLHSLQQSLLYLNLNECDLNEEDFESLATSKHACTVQELGLAGVCGLVPNDDMAAHPVKLMECLKNFTNIIVISIAKNQLTDELSQTLLDVVQNQWHQLKSLRLHANPDLSLSMLKQLIDVCASLDNFQKIVVPNNTDMRSDEFEKNLTKSLETNKRTDIKVTTMVF